MAVSRSKDVEAFGPPIKEGAIFPKGKVFAEFLLAKVVNAENAAHRSEKFVTMATRTRQEYLKDLVMNYSTSTPVDTGQKFCKFIICKFSFHFFMQCLCFCCFRMGKFQSVTCGLWLLIYLEYSH